MLGKRDKYIPKNIAKKGNLMKISEIMKLESLEIKNFKSIPYMNIKKIGAISLFLGTNGSGKTAIFDAMRFIRECVMARDITAPLQRRGGFYDLLHRNSESSKIHFKLVLSNKDDPEHKLTYTLEINGSDTVTVSKEDLTETQKIGKNYENSKLFNYRKGKGYITDPKNEKRELQATNIALGKLGEFTEYKKVNAFRNYVADWYFADLLDTDKPVYTQMSDIVPKVIDEPLFPGVYNEVWSVKMFDESTDTELCLTLTDPDTIYLQERHRHGTSEPVSTLIYERAESFLPETLQSALYEEPFDSLIFYWDNPPEDVYTPLEAMLKTELEPNGSDRLLLVGRHYETQIRFCTGEGIWDDSGNLLDWVADETLYENVIENNEPHWFSMTVPEGVTNICLYIKRPWDDIWYLWPVTDTGSYTVNGWTFLTPKKQ